MSMIERYRKFFEYEKDCNQKMLAMIDSVPKDERSDPKFRGAVTLAHHIVAGRENWLERMTIDKPQMVEWWDENCDFATLPARFAAMEAKWDDYFAFLDDEKLSENFEFTTWDGREFPNPIEAQIVQLSFHAVYHRGQIAMLVDRLGGVTVDTDYAFWAVPGSDEI